MWITQHRKQALALFIATLLFMMLIVITFWNRNRTNANVWPLLFYFMATITASVIYIIFRRSTNPQAIEAVVKEKIDEERARVLSEINKKDEDKSDDTTLKVDERAEAIMPKGSFKSLESFAKKLLLNLSAELQIVIGIVYTTKNKGNAYTFLAGFALPSDIVPADFKSGENLNGQTAISKELMILQDLPEDYFTIESGLGNGKPKNLIIAPIVHNNKTIAIIEFATFIKVDKNTEQIIQKLCGLAADKMAQL